MASIKINGLNIAYDDVGKGNSVVLVHGYPFNRSLWQPQVESLHSSFRITTIDLPGFGESDASESPLSINEMAKYVSSVMDHLQIEQAIVGGLSMGGYVVLAFYRSFAERVRALVLGDTRAEADSSEARETREQQAIKILAEGMETTASTMLPKLLTADTLENRPQIVDHVRKMILGAKPKGAAAALRAMASRDDQTSLLSKVKVPTLILVGVGDTLTPVKYSEVMHEAISLSRLIKIENAAHVSNLEQAEVWNAELRNFLSAI